jgi:hypothetical protein
LKIVNAIGEMVEIKLGNIYMRVYPDSNLHDFINQYHAKETIEVLEEKISNLKDVIDEYATGKR